MIALMADAAQERRWAHAYPDQLSPAQLSAVRALLETMLDPVSRNIATAPFEDEEISQDEEQAAAQAKKWFEEHPEGIPFDEVLAEFGLTTDDLKKYDEPR